MAAGRLDLGVLDIHDLALARALDLVGVAALMRRPLAALVAQREIPRPRALEGRLVGVSGLPSDPPSSAPSWPTTAGAPTGSAG